MPDSHWTDQLDRFDNVVDLLVYASRSATGRWEEIAVNGAAIQSLAIIDRELDRYYRDSGMSYRDIMDPFALAVFQALQAVRQAVGWDGDGVNIEPRPHEKLVFDDHVATLLALPVHEARERFRWSLGAGRE